MPCVECNMSIKFHDLLITARELGAQVLATGHYVASRPLPSGGRALYRAREEERDQSYFLFGTTREQLDVLRFPLGERAKSETRELARSFGLAIADKHDSQDICFVPTGHYADVIERLKPGAAEAGEIVDLDGNVLGTHSGIIHFTIGQRRGLGVATGAPLYVVRLDAERRRVVVGPREALRTSRIVLRDVNWIGDGGIDESARRRPARSVREGALDPAAAGRLAAAAPMAATRSNWWTARMAFRPARPACSTTQATARRACSAAASSRARSRPIARAGADERMAAAAARS